MSKVERNQEDKRLLQEDPDGLIVRYQPSIEIIVIDFIRRGLFDWQDKSEVMQMVNERLIGEKIPKMQQQYDGSAFVITYFSQIVRNLCLEIHRKQSRKAKPQVQQDLEEVVIPDPGVNVLEKIAIEQERERLAAILRMYARSKAKLVLCLKLFSRVAVSINDLEDCFGALERRDILAIHQQFGHAYDDMTDKAIYAYITPFFNRSDGKQNSPDALRKWIQAKVEEIILLMNGKPKQANYEPETLKILVRNYYESSSTAPV